MFALYFGDLLTELDNLIGLDKIGAYADDLAAIV